jgi:fumarate hydratase subunit alpha
MRDIDCKQITETVSSLFQEGCLYLPEDVLVAIKQAREKEESPVARDVLDKIIENTEVSKREKIPLCQDTGAAVVMLELGQEVHIKGGNHTY